MIKVRDRVHPISGQRSSLVLVSSLPGACLLGQCNVHLLTISSTIYRLTLGLMGLDELHLRVLATASDDEKERRNAQKGVALFHRCRHDSLTSWNC